MNHIFTNSLHKPFRLSVSEFDRANCDSSISEFDRAYSTISNESTVVRQSDDHVHTSTLIALGILLAVAVLALLFLLIVR